MRERIRMALGVDVGQTEVCTALVRRDRRQLVLVHAAQAPLPDGVIQDGRIQNPVALAKVLAGLKGPRLCWVPGGGRTAVSLSGSSARMQILELPDPIPPNIGAFVQGEIRQSVALGGAQIVSDYCTLTSQESRRLLAAVADGGHTLSLVQACERTWAAVDVVEPSFLSVIRALYAKAIRPSAGHVLVVILRGRRMDLAAFKGGHLDYIRSQDMADTWSDPEALCTRLAREIHAVFQYYEMEVAPVSEASRILVLTEDGIALPTKAPSRLSPRGSQGQAEILTSEQVGASLGVECRDPALLAKASPTAVGLAVRLLVAEGATPRVNLLPTAIVQRRVARKYTLIAAAVAAAALVVMAMAAMGLTLRTEGLRRDLLQKREAGHFDEMVNLLTQHRNTKARIDDLSAGNRRIEEVLKAQRKIDWPGLLDDIRSGTPAGVYITRLTSAESERPELVIEGFSFQSGTLHLFTNRLNESERVASATLVKSDQEALQGKPYFVYLIRCLMESKEGT